MRAMDFDKMSNTEDIAAVSLLSNLLPFFRN